MNEDDFKPNAKIFLNEIGLIAYDIPKKADCETPDFEVVGENSRYTIELKIKSDDPEEIRRDLEILSRGEILSKSTPVGPRNRMYGVVKKGVNQMDEHDPENKTLGYYPRMDSDGQYLIMSVFKGTDPRNGIYYKKLDYTWSY